LADSDRRRQNNTRKHTQKGTIQPGSSHHHHHYGNQKVNRVSADTPWYTFCVAIGNARERFVAFIERVLVAFVAHRNRRHKKERELLRCCSKFPKEVIKAFHAFDHNRANPPRN